MTMIRSTYECDAVDCGKTTEIDTDMSARVSIHEMLIDRGWEEVLSSIHFCPEHILFDVNDAMTWRAHQAGFIE